MKPFNPGSPRSRGTADTPAAKAFRWSRSSLVKTAFALAFVVALIVIPLATPGTQGAFTASIKNSVNSAKVMSFYSCQQVLAGETGRVFAYQLNTTKPVNMVDNSSAATATTNISLGTTATGCTRDTNGFMKFTGNYTSPSTVRYTTSVTPPQTFTQELWFQTTVPQGNLMALTNNATYLQETKFDRELYLSPTGQLNMTNYVLGGTSAIFEQIRTPASVADGQWHHVVATRDAAAGQTSMYLDGTLVGSMPTKGTLDTYSPATWRIGCARVDTWPNAPGKKDECFNGNMAFAAVYNRAFTQQDVTNHYKAGTW